MNAQENIQMIQPDISSGLDPEDSAALVKTLEQFQSLIDLFRAQQLTICSCESFTAGMFTALAGSISGASAVLKGGLVTYFTEMKIKIAHVDPALIETYGVVSGECAKAMAENTRKLFDADFCVSFTGNAGPLAMEEKPAGLVYCAIASKKKTMVFEWKLPFSRNRLRLEACSRIAQMLIDEITQTVNAAQE